MKKSVIYGIVAVLMIVCVFFVYKHNSDNSRNVQEKLETTQDTQGVQLPTLAKEVLNVSVEKFNTPNVNTDVQPQPTKKKKIYIVGSLNKLPKGECLEKYKYSLLPIALYVSMKDNMDFSMCHAVASSDIGRFCRGSERCEKSSRLYLTVYDMLLGKHYDFNACVSGLNKQICEAMDSFVNKRGREDELSQYVASWLSGDSSVCSKVGKYERYDCLNIAEIAKGVKTGLSKSFFYSALKRSDCSKVDAELLDKYCSNKVKPNVD